MSDLCNMCRPPDERSAPAGMSPLAPSRAILDKNGRQLISIDSHVLVGPMAAERHAHHELEISCVPSGYGTYHINEKFYDIRPGDVFILPNTDYHGLELADGQKMNNLVIHFDTAFIWNSLASDLDYNFLLVFFENGKNFSHRLDRDNPATRRIFSLMMEIM